MDLEKQEIEFSLNNRLGGADHLDIDCTLKT